MRKRTCSASQQEQLNAIAAGRVGCLIGGPGTGKTFTLSHWIKAMRDVGPVAVAAPTGKAAVRLTENLQQMHILLEASTIHRLLGVRGRPGGEWEFIHNSRNPLPHAAFAIDEASMLSIPLLASLLDAIPRGARVMFCGDTGQLPPIEHGAPLRDMVAAGVPTGELTELHRHSGAGVRMCHAIRAGQRYTPPTEFNLATGENVLHLESRNNRVSRQRLIDLMSAPPADLNPIMDIQVIVPLNKRGDLSRESLNTLLQDLLNPVGQMQDGKGKYRVGDKVILLKPSCLPTMDDDDEDATEFIANGEIGRVLWIESSKLVVEFSAPKRVVRISRAKMIDIDLAYAITVHKSQGSQWPVVIYLPDETSSARRVSCRELVYTALSRFQRMLVTIGRAATINRDCKRVVLPARKTFLKEMLSYGSDLQPSSLSVHNCD